MNKISIIGIDNTGKTSIVKSLDKITGIDTIHLTKNKNNDCTIAKYLGKITDNLAKFGEDYNSKSLTGFAYLMHLLPYKLEERAKKFSQLLISDRDPIIDTLCYSEFYLPNKISSIVQPSLKFFLENSFNYPSSIIYLETTPEKSAKRNTNKNQLHEEIKSLTKLQRLFDEQMFLLRKKGTAIHRIDTNTKSLEEVTEEARFLIK
jgi:thymidylate kinase